MAILKYIILFVLTVFVLSLGIYLVTNLPEKQTQSSGQNASITTIKNSGSSSIIQSIIAEFTKKSEHTSSNSDGSGVDIVVTGGGSSGQTGSQSSNASTPTYISPCVLRYNLTMHTIIFYYADEPHSNVMVPIVENLSSEYTFYKTQSLWDESFNSCFGLSGITPTFVCAGTREKISGETSQSALQAFASRC